MTDICKIDPPPFPIFALSEKIHCHITYPDYVGLQRGVFQKHPLLYGKSSKNLNYDWIG